MTTFELGTFTPDPRPSSWPTMLAAQSRLELTLLLRNGEQLLLTMIIPITLLVGLSLLPFGDLGDHRVDTVIPGVMMVAIMSTAFTGQAIAVGFDRRYGALKRLGATPLPRWGVVAGKSVAVSIVVVLQAALLGVIGVALGWRPTVAGLAIGAVVIGLGTVTFAALGLLLGGTLKAEVVLALANILWFVLLMVGGLALMTSGVPDVVTAALRGVPSGALANALTEALKGTVDWCGVSVLALWALAAGWLATRWFRFS